jgi:hypothetical protein
MAIQLSNPNFYGKHTIIIQYIIHNPSDFDVYHWGKFDPAELSFWESQR